MKLETKVEEYNGKKTTLVTPSKFNAEKDTGLTAKDYIRGTLKFKPVFGTKQVKKVFNGKEKTIPATWMFVVADVSHPDLSQYKNEYGNVKLNLGWCQGASDAFEPGDEFIVSLKPFLDKENKIKRVLAVEKYTELTPKGKKIAEYVKANGIGYEALIKINENGTEVDKKVADLIPHYALLI